jgi:hypothetical protein
MQPDWDMFHSVHPAAEYHASARAISGGPLYVSDSPGKHNFELLRKLVLPDGSILRALSYSLQSNNGCDCFFSYNRVVILRTTDSDPFLETFESPSSIFNPVQGVTE